MQVKRKKACGIGWEVWQAYKLPRGDRLRFNCSFFGRILIISMKNPLYLTAELKNGTSSFLPAGGFFGPFIIIISFIFCSEGSFEAAGAPRIGAFRPGALESLRTGCYRGWGWGWRWGGGGEGGGKVTTKGLYPMKGSFINVLIQEFYGYLIFMWWLKRQ